MSFQPVVPFGGFAGWSFMSRTRESQQDAFNSSSSVQRDTDYFHEKIGNIHRAEDLMADRRLLTIALGAFGLDKDINNKYFIQKVLEDGTLNTDALANKLSDKRYLAFSKAFGFGDFDTPNTQLSDFPDQIVGKYQNMQFEIAVGNKDENIRLALGLERELQVVLKKDTTENGAWFSIMGAPALTEVFRVALNLPTSVASLDLDQQLTIYRDKAQSIFGNGEVLQFADPDKQDRLVQLFLLRSELNLGAAQSSRFSTALTLLQNAAR